ncbi:MAG: 2-dehydro-3-deoxygalactonokinase [Chitinophagaceae bacterium]
MSKKILSCDWGTSSFRLRLVDVNDGHIIGELSSNQGIAQTHQQWIAEDGKEERRLYFYLQVLQQYSAALLEETGCSEDDIPLVISGMASASIGMHELAYANMPFQLNGKDLLVQTFEKTKEFPHKILLISGAKTANDVMRGEETQLIGCATDSISKRQLFIFPGTHSKHVTVEEGKAISLETFMTGEFFELLSAKSLLVNSVAKSGDIQEPENKEAFAKGIAASSNSTLLHNSFLVRTNQLFNRFSKTANYYYLSGLLIGEELNQLSKNKIDKITIVGEGKLVGNYKAALSLLNIDAPIETIDAATATVKGQLTIYKNFEV